MIVLMVLGLYVLGMFVSMRPMYRWRQQWAVKTYTRYYRENMMMDDAWATFWLSFVWPLFWGWRILRVWITS